MPDRLPQRIIILGAGGQLGGEFQHLLPGAVALSHSEADLTQPESLRSILTELNPQLIINCAAFNRVDQAEEAPQDALAVNACGARNLAVVCRDLGALLVHFSTDAVFGSDLDRRIPCSELTLPGPVNVYGCSKLSGEFLVRASCPEHLVIRTCGLYGHRAQREKKTDFVSRILENARSGEELRVVNDQTCTPSFAKDIAQGTLNALGAGVRGVLHLTNNGSCTWFEFARRIIETAGLKTHLQPITSREWTAPASRPHYSVLSNDLYNRHRLPVMPNWTSALERYFAEA